MTFSSLRVKLYVTEQNLAKLDNVFFLEPEMIFRKIISKYRERLL